VMYPRSRIRPRIQLRRIIARYRSKEIDKERTLYLEIRDPYKDRGWDNAGLVVSFKKDLDKNILSIKPAYGNQSYNFSGKPADLFDFVGVVLEKYIEIKNRKTKSAKVKKLKKSAIIARINEIARENRFNFHIREYSIKVQLAIQIGEKGIVTIDIPYSKFQEELGKIESIVTSSRELERSGIVANLNFNAQNTLRQFSFFTKYDAP
ncbi:MAG: hypothetical protein GY757_41395, partial [bacterium]|nr:hypothetical protein [bacterium]